MMSTPTILFSTYFFIGLILMIVAVASPGKEKRTKGLAAFGTGDGLDAGLMIFVAVLWPVWLLAMLAKKEPNSERSASPEREAGRRLNKPVD